jgi:hypothetical protein
MLGSCQLGATPPELISENRPPAVRVVATQLFKKTDIATASAAPVFQSTILGAVGGFPKGWKLASTSMFGSRRSWLVASNVRVVARRLLHSSPQHPRSVLLLGLPFQQALSVLFARFQNLYVRQPAPAERLNGPGELHRLASR